MNAPSGLRVSRREFFAAAGVTGVGGAVLLLTGCDLNPGAVAATPPSPLRTFRSRPDLQPPTIVVRANDSRAAPGLIVLAGSGPLVVDDAGEPVWYLPYTGSVAATNVKVQLYQEEPVITWWQGTIQLMGYGDGEYVIADSSYRVLRTVHAAKGLQGDLHEFVLTPAGTALFTAYTPLAADLRPYGGPKKGFILDSVLQEVDVESGELVFEWRASKHVSPIETYAGLPGPGFPFDYFHINSINVDVDGNLLVSSRNTWCVYKIARPSGEVLWRLGGKATSFALAPGLQFSWQHNAVRQSDGTITLFDDGAAPQEEARSRGLVIAADETDREASVLRQYVHPRGLLSTSQGSMQVLPNGNVFIGYGSLPNFTEFAPDGSVLYDAEFVSQVQSYRAYRQEWTGSPLSLPDVAVDVNNLGGHTVYASWNGATRLKAWQVVAGDYPDSLTPVVAVNRAGFETAIPMRSSAGYVAVDALDASGTRLARSKVIPLPS